MLILDSGSELRSLVVDAVIDGARTAGHSARKLFLYDHTIRPCLDCRACKHGDLAHIHATIGQLCHVDAQFDRALLALHRGFEVGAAAVGRAVGAVVEEGS